MEGFEVGTHDLSLDRQGKVVVASTAHDAKREYDRAYYTDVVDGRYRSLHSLPRPPLTDEALPRP